MIDSVGVVSIRRMFSSTVLVNAAVKAVALTVALAVMSWGNGSATWSEPPIRTVVVGYILVDTSSESSESASSNEGGNGDAGSGSGTTPAQRQPDL